MNTSPAMYTIKQASDITGITASVLRIWEARYGWPLPRRRANGYRYYTQSHIDDLRRISVHVRQGLLISSLIVDGLPNWPVTKAPQLSRRTLVFTRSLPEPSQPAEAVLHRAVIEALELHRAMELLEILQRTFWTVRPQDEARIALIPVLVGISELTALGRPIPETLMLVRIVKERCDQLLQMHHAGPDAISLVPARASDHALAALVAVLMCQRGIAARPWSQAGFPPKSFLIAADAEDPVSGLHRPLGVISLRGARGSQAVNELLDASRPIPGLERATTATEPSELQESGHP